MAGFTETNLGTVVKQLGGLTTRIHMLPRVYVGETGYSENVGVVRTGTTLTGSSRNINSDEVKIIDTVSACVFESGYYLPIMSETGLEETWYLTVAGTVIPMYIIEFKR